MQLQNSVPLLSERLSLDYAADRIQCSTDGGWDLIYKYKYKYKYKIALDISKVMGETSELQFGPSQFNVYFVLYFVFSMLYFVFRVLYFFYIFCFVFCISYFIDRQNSMQVFRGDFTTLCNLALFNLTFDPFKFCNKYKRIMKMTEL